MRCSNCGVKIDPNSSFCQHCGQPINKNNSWKASSYDGNKINVSSAVLKQRARLTLENNYFYLVLLTFVSFLIMGIPVLGLLVLGIVSISLNGFFLYRIRNHKIPELSFLKIGTKNIERNSILGLLYTLYIFLWSLLFIIPGIIKKYAYAMSFYIAYDNPELSASEVLKESERMMKGNKGKLFILRLSFIGWILLSILTFCVGFVFLIPYIKAAEANFYEELIKKGTVEIIEVD